MASIRSGIGETMKDRYLFKAKRIDDGKWVVWNIFSGLYGADIDKSTICQCIGLKDKNGKLIWENDILVGYLDDNYPQEATYEMVFWNKSGFCTKEQGSIDISELCEFDQKYFEVCGNIFDNPELFESEDNMTESEAIREKRKFAIEIVKQRGVSNDVCEWKFEETNGIAWHCDDKCTTYNQVYIKDLKITLEDFECKCPYCGKKIKVVK